MRPEWRNTFYLYGIRGLQLLFPLFTLPYLARVLDRENFALVVLAQSTAIFVSLIIEYGFNYTATREISSTQGDIAEQRRIFSLVSVTKSVLSILAICIILIYGFYSQKFTTLAIVAVAILALAQGLNPVWYFQGTSNLRISAIVEIVSRAINLLVMFALIKNEEQGPEYLLFLSVITLASAMYQNIVIYRLVGFSIVTFNGVWFTLKSGLTLFIFRIGSSLYTSGSMVLLGSTVGASSFALYAGADRVFRAAAALTGPIGDAFYPRISAAELTDAVEGRRLKVLASKFLLTLSFILCAVMYFGAYLWIDLLLGKKYADAVEFFRILSFDIPLIAIGTILGVFGLLPKKLDLYFTFAVTLAGIWSVLSIYFLIPKLGLTWMAYTVLIAEVIVIVVCMMGLLFNKRNVL